MAPLLLLPGALALDAWGRRPLGAGRWDAIIVAGCKVMPGGLPSTALARRVRLAVDLWRAERAPRIVMTGGVGEHPPSEARVAADLARDLGVPASALVLEEASTTTAENARFAREIAGPVRVLVVTDAYHVLRCERVFRRHFPEVRGVGAPVPLDVAAWMGLRELGSIGLYAVRGRL